MIILEEIGTKDVFENLGEDFAVLVDMFNIPPDHIETEGLAEHRRRVEEVYEKEPEGYGVETLEESNKRTKTDLFTQLLDSIKISELDNYEQLEDVLRRAYREAAYGKGKERHGQDLLFEDQPMQVISELLGTEKGCLYQAIKKIQESTRLPEEQAVKELLGAINYIAGAIIYREMNES